MDLTPRGRLAIIVSCRIFEPFATDEFDMAIKKHAVGAVTVAFEAYADDAVITMYVATPPEVIPCTDVVVRSIWRVCAPVVVLFSIVAKSGEVNHIGGFEYRGEPSFGFSTMTISGGFELIAIRDIMDIVSII